MTALTGKQLKILSKTINDIKSFLHQSSNSSRIEVLKIIGFLEGNTDYDEINTYLDESMELFTQQQLFNMPPIESNKYAKYLQHLSDNLRAEQEENEITVLKVNKSQSTQSLGEESNNNSLSQSQDPKSINPALNKSQIYKIKMADQLSAEELAELENNGTVYDKMAAKVLTIVETKLDGYIKKLNLTVNSTLKDFNAQHAQDASKSITEYLSLQDIGTKISNEINKLDLSKLLSKVELNEIIASTITSEFVKLSVKIEKQNMDVIERLSLATTKMEEQHQCGFDQIATKSSLAIKESIQNGLTVKTTLTPKQNTIFIASYFMMMITVIILIICGMRFETIYSGYNNYNNITNRINNLSSTDRATMINILNLK